MYTRLIIVFLLQAYASSGTLTLHGQSIFDATTSDGDRYFLFVPHYPGKIQCSVTGLSSKPEIYFLKDGKPVEEMLPESLYELLESTTDEAFTLTLVIGEMYTGGFTEIQGKWSCNYKDPEGGVVSSTFYTKKTEYPTIDFNPRLNGGVAKAGTTITLTCKCPFISEFEDRLGWKWFVGNGTPTSRHISYVDSVDGKPSDKLRIEDLSRWDSDKYSCSCGIGEIRFNSNPYEMVVMEPPRRIVVPVLKNSTMNSLTISWDEPEGSGVITKYKVVCTKEGSDTPLEMETPSNKPEFTINSLMPLTSYNVKVAARNNAGVGLFSEVKKFKTDKPTESKPIIIRPKLAVTEMGIYLVQTTAGQNVSLTCEVSSYPASAIKWKFMSKELKINDNSVEGSGIAKNYEYAIEELNDFKTVYTLSMLSADRNNQGLYKCEATNTEGVASLTYSVEVIQQEDNSSEATRSESSRNYCNMCLLSTVTLLLLLLQVLTDN